MSELSQLQKVNCGETRVVIPENLGWLEYRLKEEEMNYVKQCIDNRKGDHRKILAGNIKDSNTLYDKDNWFFNNTIQKLIHIYGTEFNNLGEDTPLNQFHPYHLSNWWVNYQYKHEFNPLHTHTGVYSFVIWVKIPTDFEKQNEDNVSNMPSKSAFKFIHTDNLGQFRHFNYELTPTAEGIMLFFPSKLNHVVYPFYKCDEERISISGNIGVDTTRAKDQK